MILNVGQRTDIPAFYARWFANRLKEGYVLARNPYYPKLVHRYDLSPRVVDVICFGTKNPEPMFPYMDLLKPYRQYWFVTITPYGHDIEPGVPDKWKVMDALKILSDRIGMKHTAWRYDPIFITEKYSESYHYRAFEKMCSYMEGYVPSCTISFIDLYEKTKRNFPEVREVPLDTQERMAERFVQIASAHGISIRSCLESQSLGKYGIDTDGCMSQKVVEEAIGQELKVPAGHETREGCHCLLGSDIGAYNSCLHGCRYCYANYDMELVRENNLKHDPESPLLIGHLEKDDLVKDAVQKSWIIRQMKLPL